MPAASSAGTLPVPASLPPPPPPPPVGYAGAAAGPLGQPASVGAAPPPPPPSASPLLREVTQHGRLYLLDTRSGLVYRDSEAQAGLLERVGKWAKGSGIVFVPPLSESAFFSALRSFLDARQLGLADLFGALDADMDGGLEPGELAALAGHVVPGAVPSEVAYLTALIDWDDDGYIGLGDLLDADEAAEAVAEERAEGADSPWARVLQDTSYILHTQRRHAQVVFATLAAGGEAAWPADSPASSPRHDAWAAGAVERAWADPGDGDEGASAGGSPPVLLEPASLLRFLRIMRPELSPGEARYVMDHLLQGPGDSRRSLPQVLHCLHLADVAYSADAQRGEREREGKREAEQQRRRARDAKSARQREQGQEAVEEEEEIEEEIEEDGAARDMRSPRQGRAESEAAAAEEGAEEEAQQRQARQLSPHGSGNVRRRPGSMPGLNRAPPLAPSRWRRRSESPREAVPRFFYHLGFYMRRCRLTLPQLFAQYDSNGDGALEPGELRSLVAEVMPAGSGREQFVYIRASISSPTSAFATLDDLARSIQDHEAAASAGRQDASALAAGMPPPSPMAHLYLAAALAAAGGAAPGSGDTGAVVPGLVPPAAEAYLAARAAQLAAAQRATPVDVLSRITQHMIRHKVQLATLMAQFDRDRDGRLSAQEAARLLAYVAPGARSTGAGLGRAGAEAGGGGIRGQRSADLALQRLMAEADRDRDGLLSYNDLRLALLARQGSLFRERLAVASQQAAERAAAQAAATAAVLLGPAEPAPPATLRRPPHTADDAADAVALLPFWAPAPGSPGSPGADSGRRAVHFAPLPGAGASGGGFYPGMRPVGTSPEDYDVTAFAPSRPGDAGDPFTLAFAAQHPQHPTASQLPPGAASLSPFPPPPPPQQYQMHQLHPVYPEPGASPRAPFGHQQQPAGGSIGGGGGGRFGALPPDVSLGDVEELDPDVTLQPVDYMGARLMVDPVSGLVFMPIAPGAPGEQGPPVARLGRPRAGPAALAAGAAPQQPEGQEEQLYLFGRLLPNGTVQRVETPLAAQLFAALDAFLRTSQCRLEDAWTQAVAGTRYPAPVPGAPPPPPPPPADAAGLSRFLRPLLPGLSPSQVAYLRLLLDLDGDGLVEPDDLLMAFEEIGTTIDTPANKLHAHAYKLLARVAGVVLGDYVESYRVFAAYGGNDRRKKAAGEAAAGSGRAGGASAGGATAAVSEDVQLTVPQLARFVSHLTGHTAAPEDLGAVIVYLTTKLAEADSPAGAAAAAAALPGPNQPYGNPYASPGGPFRRLRDAPPLFDWPLLVGVLRAIEASLPVDRRPASPEGRGRGGRPRRGDGEAPAEGGAGGAAAGAAAQGTWPGSGTAAGGMDRDEYWQHAADAAAAAAAAAGEGGGSGSYEEAGEEGPLERPPPLRSGMLTLPPAPHPDRRVVELCFYGHPDGRTFLLDPATGLLYVATPHILAAAEEAAARAAEALAEAHGPEALRLPVTVGVTPAAAAGVRGGPPPPAPPPPPPPALLLPCPDLAGKLHHPDARLMPARAASGLALVCGALLRAAADEGRTEALFRMMDRDGQGLDAPRLQTLLRGVASLTRGETAFAMALLDQEGSGRVGLQQLREAAELVHFAATAVGPQPGPAPPLTLTLSRCEARAMHALHCAAAAMQREWRLLWLLMGRATAPAGSGPLDRSSVRSVLSEVLAPYLPLPDVRVALAYLDVMAPEGADGAVTPDELVQLLRAVPMRLRLPYTPAVPGAEEAAEGAEGAVAVGPREVIFASGFGGPVAADGTLPPIEPTLAGAADGRGAKASYRRQLRHPTGPTHAEPEALYGPNDGAALYDSNMPYDDPDWGEGRFGLAAAALASAPRKAGAGAKAAALSGAAGRRPGKPAADQRSAQEDAGQYGLYDDDDTGLGLYGEGQAEAEPRLPKRAPGKFLSPRALDPSAAEGPISRLARRAGHDPYSLAGPGRGGGSGGGVGSSVTLEEEAALVDALRGREPGRRLQRPDRTRDGFDTGTQYGLLSDVDPGRRGLAGGPPQTPRAAEEEPEEFGLGAEAGERPARLTTSSSSSSSDSEGGGRIRSGSRGGSRPSSAAFPSDVPPPVFDPYGSREAGGGGGHGGGHWDSPSRGGPGAGSLPPSRPLTAATASLASLGVTSSAASMPRLASPALEPLASGAPGPRPRTATEITPDASTESYGMAAEAVGAVHGTDDYDPYGDPADSPQPMGHARRGVVGGGAMAFAGGGGLSSSDGSGGRTSASGPALLTSFGDALHEDAGRGGAGEGAAGRRSLPSPAAQVSSRAGGPAARSRLSRSSIPKVEQEEEEEAGGAFGLGAEAAGPRTVAAPAAGGSAAAAGGRDFDPYGLGAEAGAAPRESSDGGGADAGGGLADYDEADLGGSDEIDYGLGAEGVDGDDF
ncbi:hypothetical protein GPECTOR_113g283 [Gonium pectorale]|uniref:EF-hand domain-containing protein n=1 Tax=Gonium pectorale TaxID=33097 RepID=A0A150FZ38_GONPE|nr:hypothetical protein GPECTOR_113g283 [Gonium pectorale]|eukprot:KXZ42871.1 hypothetical protein GPECTOR_113g283 [Gonium pectorale]